MQGVVMLGGYGENRNLARLATPRASIKVSVYGLSVDVFYYKHQNPGRSQ